MSVTFSLLNFMQYLMPATFSNKSRATPCAISETISAPKLF